MEALLDNVVFSVGDKSYCWRDVVHAAILWGEWAKLEESLREGIACSKLAEGAEDGPSKPEVTEAARAFRYERGLISAEETEQWLERWGLAVSDWMGYLHRFLARQWWAGVLDASSVRQISDQEVESLIKSEAACSGKLAAFAWKLAGRAAIHGKMEEEAVVESSSGCSNHASDAGGRTRVDLCSSPGIDSFANGEIVRRLTAVDRSFARFARSIGTVRIIEEQVRSHYLAWIRLRCLWVSFPEGEVAKEAAQWVRQDGMTLAAAAAAAKAEVQESSFYLEQVESELSSQLVGARQGEFLGPLTHGGAPTLFVVLDKIMPSLDDSELRAKAEESALQSAIDIAVVDRVRWAISL